VVGLNTVLTGDIEAQDSVCVEGTVLGNLKCRSMVIIGVKGRIEGDVEAAAAIIGGTVKGNVKVEELLEMLKSAAVLGDISTSRLQVAPGAVLKGRCSMTPR
jgi:cytoskeletal protein CcmA (bactofilin family)